MITRPQVNEVLIQVNEERVRVQSPCYTTKSTYILNISTYILHTSTYISYACPSFHTWKLFSWAAHIFTQSIGKNSSAVPLELLLGCPKVSSQVITLYGMVQSIYKNKQTNPTPKKLLQKVFRWCLVLFDITNK